MKKTLLMLHCLLVSFTGIQAQEVTLDFTSNDWGLPEGSSKKAVSTATFTNGEYSIELTGTSGAGYYYNADGYLMLGKNGATLSLPAFDFAVSKIEIVGRTGASTSTLENIYVGSTAVSTQIKGSAATNVFEIAADYQAAGNIYTFKVESKHNAQLTYIKVYSAEAPKSKVITSVDELSNNKCYTIVSKDTGRGGMFAAEGAAMVDMCGVTYNQAQECHSIARDESDPRQQFAFVNYEGKLYLYSVSEKKFVVKSGNVNKLTNEAPIDYVEVSLEASSGGDYFSIKLGGTNYMTASPGWCSNPERNTCLQSTLTAKDPDQGWDDGAWYTITEVAGFNADEAIEMLTPPLTVSTIADVIAAGAADAAKVEGTIVATYARGFLVQDATGSILVYEGSEKEHNVGDVVTVEGKTSLYGGLLQFSNVEVVKTGDATVEYPSAVAMDGAALDAYLATPTVQYVEYVGTLNISNNYYNVTVEGATTAVASIQYPKAGVVAAELNGKVIKVTGYVIGISGTKYVSTMAVKVEEYKAAPETFTVTAGLFPTPQDPENITEIKAIRVQHNEGAVISEVPTAWTLTNENGDVIETRVEWGLASFDDIFVMPTTTITEAGTYTLTVPAGSLTTDTGKEVEAATFSWTIKANEPETPTYEYNEGDRNHGERALTSFTITDGTNSLNVTDIHQTGKGPIFVDKTDNVLETVPGARINFTEFNYLGVWMHAFAYIDYNNDYTFGQDANATGATGGELVTYNCYSTDESNYYDIWGNTASPSNANSETYYDEDFNESKGLPHFFLPADLAAGDYRMRIKVDWNNLDPVQGSKDMVNGGCEVDFIIRVAEVKTYEYNEGDRNHGERALTSFTITDGTNSLNVTDIHQIGKGPIFVDKTDNVLETTAGARIHFSEFNYLGVWMHAYAYIDYNNDYTFGQDANATGTTGGELVTYNFYRNGANDGDGWDIWGNTASASNANHDTYYDEEFNESKGLPHFFLPADLAAGDYRMRIKVDWDNLDPVKGSKDMVNGGCEVDFIVRVAEAAVEPLTVAAITPEAGNVESIKEVVVTFDSELASVDASKISVEKVITPIEAYAGKWELTSSLGTNSYDAIVNVEVVEKDGVKMLKGSGVSGKDEYVDEFYMSYNEADGSITLEYQTLEQYNGMDVFLFMGYSTSSGLDYGKVVGKINNGNIVFTSEDGADSFIICYYYGGYYVLSYFCELTWTPATEAAAPAKAFNINNSVEFVKNIAPAKVAKAEETEAAIEVSASVNGKDLIITTNVAANGTYKLVVAEGAVVAANGATNGNIEAEYNVYREPTTIVNVTPAKAVTELDVIEIEYNVEIAGEFDVMGMTQIYVGSKSNGAAYEVNGKVLTIDLFNSITTPGDYALHIPAGLITRVSDGSDVTCDGEIVFTVKEPGYEYVEGNSGNGSRRLDSFTITDGTNSLTVTDIQATTTSPIFVDKTDNVLETTAGAYISFTEFNWEGYWMHAYAYIDYNNDFNFDQVANADGTTGGELVTYNCYSTDGGSTYQDIYGNTASPENANKEIYYDEDFNESKGLPQFYLPADLAAGDYRMRIKIDWNNIDPLGDKDIRPNGGAQVDFIIRVAEATGIENVEVENGAQVIYDLTGRKVENANVRGIYIINGKKVLVK